MKKLGLLAASVGLALAGCGGSSSEDSSGGGTTFTVTAIDGYLAYAEVYGTDKALCDRYLGLTDNKGQIPLSTSYQGKTVCVDAVAGFTVDSNRGIVEKSFRLMNADASAVVNPMTNLVVQLMGKGESFEDAQQQVVERITEAGLTPSQSLIFGDYIADTSEQAAALNIIGEVLVDYSDEDIDTLLDITTAVAEDAQRVISDDSESLDDYIPIIDIPDNGGGVTVTPNNRPTVIGIIEDIEQDLEDQWVEIDASTMFKDIDGDGMTYVMREVTRGEMNGISINSSTGLINGTIAASGEFVYHIFAIDDHDARSYPLPMQVSISTSNTPPIVDDAVRSQLQSEVTSWDLTEGEALAKTLTVDQLFSDEDGDNISYATSTTLSVDAGNNNTGFRSSVDRDGVISFHGTLPRSAAAKAETFSVYAYDGVNIDPVKVTFELPQIAAAPVYPDHPLENANWYFLEWGSDDGSDGGHGESPISRVWCDTVRFENGHIYMSQRNPGNLTSCSDDTVQLENSRYTVRANVLELTIAWEDEEDGWLEEKAEISVVDHSDDINTGAKTVLWMFEDDYDGKASALQAFAGRNNDDDIVEEYYRQVWFKQSQHAEERIQLESDFDEVQFKMHLPGEQDGQYELGYVSIDLGYPHPSDSGSYNADVIFDMQQGSITCDLLREFYEEFVLTGFDADGNHFISRSGQYGSFECYDNEENGVTYAGVDFDIYEELKVGEVYSIIGYPKFKQAEYIEDIKFNIKWTGQGN